MSKRDPNSLPPEHFSPEIESDVLAYFDVIPNFVFGGRWYSKARYCLVFDPSTGGRCVMRRGAPLPSDEVVRKGRPYDLEPVGDEETADPVDWSGPLMEQYLYRRRRLSNQGKDEQRAHPGALGGLPVARWAGPGTRL